MSSETSVCTSVLLNGQQGDWVRIRHHSSPNPIHNHIRSIPVHRPVRLSVPWQIENKLQIVLSTGLLIDCFKTIEYFQFRFCSQNHCLFFIDSFFSKESKIYCISDCLQKRTGLASSDQKRDVLQKPRKAVKVSNKEWQMPDLGTEIAKNRG